MTAAHTEDVNAPAHEIPQELAAARAHAKSMTAKAREAVRQLVFLKLEQGQDFSAGAVQTIYQWAVKSPDRLALAECLCELAPLQAKEGDPALDAAQRLLIMTGNMRKLQGAVLEAGLAEQQDRQGALRSASTFSAAALEKSLDEWILYGRQRGAAAHDMPLSRIDDLVALKTSSFSEQVATRLGLVIFALPTVHIWRQLEQMPQAQQVRLGWCAPAEEGMWAAASCEDSNLPLQRT